MKSKRDVLYNNDNGVWIEKYLQPLIDILFQIEEVDGLIKDFGDLSLFNSENFFSNHVKHSLIEILRNLKLALDFDSKIKTKYSEIPWNEIFKVGKTFEYEEWSQIQENVWKMAFDLIPLIKTIVKDLLCLEENSS